MYTNIDFLRFSLAATIVAVPMFFLAQPNRQWATGYAVLILMGFAVANFRGLERASAFASGELGKKNEQS